eukprot:GHVR01049020.1.p1 GENE.GHVR01049020.1~~GHVR01049020.1.p1  ORF type:complete len:248 (+),score=55.45 GHVR01049020.1:64-807(+)
MSTPHNNSTRLQYQIVPYDDQSLFSRPDRIKLDEEMTYSVTPEVIAKDIASRYTGEQLVLDGFAGAGGNTIQLSYTCGFVIGLEINKKRIFDCQHNGHVYNSNFDLILGDFMLINKFIRPNVFDGLFLSPPWGGKIINRSAVFSLRSMSPISGVDVLNKALSCGGGSVCYYLPRHCVTWDILNIARICNSVCVCVCVYVNKCMCNYMLGGKCNKNYIEYLEKEIKRLKSTKGLTKGINKKFKKKKKF